MPVISDVALSEARKTLPSDNAAIPVPATSFLEFYERQEIYNWFIDNLPPLSPGLEHIEKLMDHTEVADYIIFDMVQKRDAAIKALKA